MIEEHMGKLLLDAIASSESDHLLKLASQNKVKKCEFTFLEALRCLTIEEIETAFLQLFAVVESHAAAALEITDTELNNDPENKCSDVSTKVIQVAVDIGLLTFDETLSIPTGLLQLSILLHGVLLGFSDKKDNLKNSIAHLCEKLYHGNIAEKELLAPNTVIYLLKRTLKPKTTKVDVKRVWAMKKILADLLHLPDVDKEELWFLFKKCAESKLYLSLPEGQRFLSLVLTLDFTQSSKIHDTIKKHLTSCTMKQSEVYGKTYFDAWSSAVKSGSFELKQELELSCIQDLMYHAVHVRRNIPKSLVPILRKLLAYFHSQKKEIYVSKMLRNLYEPILWRSFTVADGDTRANAAQLFFDVFPLEDPDFNVVETDLELTKQMLIIKDLLVDEYPVVRSIAAIGVCIAMSVHWELFSPEMLKTYFKILIEDLSCDSASADVRCAVVKGMKVLLENHLAIPTLKVVLPKMQGLFHDISEKVRILFCRLLLQVKKICAIKYYDIVPVDHLLARLEEDSNTVAKLIVNLTHNSYLPKNEPLEFWLARCVELIKADRSASRVFFRHVSSFITIETIVKFMLQACKALHLYAVTKSSVSFNSVPTSDNKENVSNVTNKSLNCLEETMGFHNPDIVAGLIDGIAILWVASQSSLEKPENKDMHKLLIGKFSKYLRLLLVFFKNSDIWESIYYLSSFLPPSSIPNLSGLCLSRLKNLPPDAEPQNYLTLLECLCNQNRSSEILELVTEWIQAGFDEDEPKPTAKKLRVKDKKKVIVQDPCSPKPFLGVQFLHTLLDKVVCRNAVLKRNPDKLKELLNIIDIAKRKIEKSMKLCLTAQDSSFLSGTLYGLLKIAVLLQGEKKFNSVEFVEDFIKWTTKNLMKNDKVCMISNESTTRGKKMKFNVIESWKKLTVVICKDLLNVVTDMTFIGFVNDNSHNYLKFGLDVLKLDSGPSFVHQMFRLLLNSSIQGNYRSVKTSAASGMQESVSQCFCDVMQCLQDIDFLSKLSPPEVKEAQSIFAKFLQYGHNPLHMPKELRNNIETSLLKGVISDLKTNVEDQEMEPFQKISIPDTSAFFLSVITVKPDLIVMFVRRICKWLSEESLEDIQTWIACYITLLHLIQSKNAQEKARKDIEKAMGLVEKSLNQLYPENPSNLDVANKSQDRYSGLPAHCLSELNILKDLVFKTET